MICSSVNLLFLMTPPYSKESENSWLSFRVSRHTYGHILGRRHGQHVDRLLLYWTSEPRKQDALMVLPYNPRRVEEEGLYFDETVRRIQAREFAVTTTPEAAICKECDLKILCHAEGIISMEARG